MNTISKGMLNIREATTKLHLRPLLLSSVRPVSFLGFLKPNDGSVTGYKRLGRGPSSGKGKTSGRGQKGQKARGTIPRWFEGGQTPFYKRFPIVGFKRAHRKTYVPVNLRKIQDFWDSGRISLNEGDVLTIKAMKDCGLISGSVKDGVKILAQGGESYSVPLNIEASRASEQAIEAIENNGNKFTSHYFTPLSLKAHIDPDYFYLKKGYLPLAARPTHRRDIEYYSNSDKRGYLLKDRGLLLDHMGSGDVTKSVERKSELEKQLEIASSKTYNDYVDSKVVTIDKF